MGMIRHGADEKYPELREILMLDATGWIVVRMHKLQRGDLFCFSEDPNVRWKCIDNPVKNGPVWGVKCIPNVTLSEIIHEA
jgi:hypothetical protein